MVSREVVAPQVQLPANFVERLAKGIAESRANTVVSMGGKPILRLLKDGAWVFGQGSEEVQEGSRWAINVATIEHGYVCWIEGAIRGETMASVFNHKPAQLEPIQYIDSKDGQTKLMPYKEQRSFDMRCMDGDDKGTEVLYKVSSKSGIDAISKLFAALEARTVDDKAYIFPVVVLKKDHYPHKQHGRIYTPIFEIVGWVDANGNVPAPNGRGAPTEEEAVKEVFGEPTRTRQRKPPLGTPAEEPQTTQQAHAAPVRRRPGR